MHRIRSETLGKTLAETLWCEKSRQESCRDPLRDSWWDSFRDFSHERVLPRVFPRVSDRILCMTLSETLSEILFFTREGTLISDLFKIEVRIGVHGLWQNPCTLNSIPLPRFIALVTDSDNHLIEIIFSLAVFNKFDCYNIERIFVFINP